MRARILKVLGAGGVIVGIVTHGQLLDAVVRRTAVDIAVQAGVRPARVLCVDCRAVVEVHRRGRLPLRCRECRRPAGTRCMRA